MPSIPTGKHSQMQTIFAVVITRTHCSGCLPIRHVDKEKDMGPAAVLYVLLHLSLELLQKKFALQKKLQKESAPLHGQMDRQGSLVLRMHKASINLQAQTDREQRRRLRQYLPGERGAMFPSHLKLYLHLGRNADSEKDSEDRGLAPVVPYIHNFSPPQYLQKVDACVHPRNIQIAIFPCRVRVTTLWNLQQTHPIILNGLQLKYSSVSEKGPRAAQLCALSPDTLLERSTSRPIQE